MHDELDEQYTGMVSWGVDVGNCLLGPRVEIPADDERQGRIVARARRWCLSGTLEGELGLDEKCDYQVCVDFTGKGGDGHMLEWQHLSLGVMDGCGILEEEYDAMVSRVEGAFAAVVRKREEMDGVTGLTRSGMQGVVDAFYFDGRKSWSQLFIESNKLHVTSW